MEAVRRAPYTCPFCGSDNGDVDSERPDIDTDTMTCDTVFYCDTGCGGCGSEWTLTFKLDTVSDDN